MAGECFSDLVYELRLFCSNVKRKKMSVIEGCNGAILSPLLSFQNDQSSKARRPLDTSDDNDSALFVAQCSSRSHCCLREKNKDG